MTDTCRVFRTALIGAMLAAASAAPAFADPVQDGHALAGSCLACHAVTPGRTLLGPTLAGVVNRRAGSVPGFAYSPAMAASGLVWTAANLDRFIANPRATVPGTRMVYVGMPDPAQRAKVIAWLGSLR